MNEVTENVLGNVTENGGNISGVINGAGWEVLTTKDHFESLKDIHNDSKGTRHQPVQHWDCVNRFCDVIAKSGIGIRQYNGMLSPNKQKFIFTASMTDSRLPDMEFNIGFISFNDKSRALTCFSGTKVFCCSNEVIRCNGGVEKHKHLKNIDGKIEALFSSGIEDFWQYRDNRLAMIEREKQIEVDDRMFADIILDMHKSKVFGKDPAFIGKVVNEFVAPVPRHEEFGSKSTLWGLENAMTEMYKSYNPISNIKQFEEFERIITPHLER